MHFSRIAILSFVLSFSTLSSLAQVTFDGGLKAGAVTSQVGGDGLSGFDKFGLTGGGFVKMGFDEKWALQMDILFVQKGSRKIPDTEAGDFNEYKIKLNYIEVPVTVQYNLGDFSFGVGPYVAVLVGSEIESNGGSFDPEQSYGRGYEPLDIGFLVDGSYYFSESVFVNARFTQTMIPILPAPNSTQVFWDRGQFNSVIQLMLGFSF